MPNRPCLSDDNISRLTDKSEVLNLVRDEFSESDLVLRDWKTKITTYYELYQMVQRQKHYQGLAKIFVPETLRAVETIVTQIYQMIFAQEDWFDYQSRDGEQDVKPALALTQLTYYQMDENSFKSRVMDSIRQMVIAGLTVRKILWDFQEVDRTIGKNSDGTLSKKTDTVRDTWTFEPVDILTFQISDINIPYNDIQKAIWIGEQYIARKEWVKEKIKRGWFSDQMRDDLDKIDSASASIVQQDVRNRESSSGYNQISLKHKFEIKERWGLLPCKWVYTVAQMSEMELEDDDKCEGVIVTANDLVILKLEANPFWHNQKPYVVCPYVPKENELPGIGAAQIGQSLQEELNDTRNQNMDNKTLILSTMWLKSRTSGIKNQDLTIRANGVITTNDMNGLKALNPPIIAGVGVNLEGVIKNDLRESVGAASNLQGIAQSGVGTATESSIINKQSIGRLQTTGTLFGELVLKQTLIFAEYLNYQFYDHIKVINIIGPNGVKFRKLSPDEIAGGNKIVAIKISTDITENPAVMRQQYMGFITQLVQMPPEQLAFHYKALDRGYKMFFGGHSLSEIYENPMSNPADLLTPEEERDCIIAGQGVLAQKGQDHEKYIEYLGKELNQMKLALSPIKFDMFTKLIMSHQEMLQEENLALQQRHLTQMLMASTAQEQGQQGKSGNIVNRGQTQNTTPFNQAGAPSTSSLRKGIGG